MNSVVLRISAGLLVAALIAMAASLYISGRLLEEQYRLAAAGDFESAMDRVQLAARLDPFSPDPLQDKSTLLQRQGRNQEAENALKEAVRRNPPDDAPRSSLAYLQSSRLNDYAAAEETYRETLEYNPNSVLAVNGLAQALLRQEKLEKAKQQFEALREMKRITPRGAVRSGPGLHPHRRARERRTGSPDRRKAAGGRGR